MLRETLAGAIAGATGNLALEIVTYGDMLLRGRAASGVPAIAAGAMADRLGIDALATSATGDRADNRRSAAGALLGYRLGVGLGSLYGHLRPRLGRGRVPIPLAGAAVGLTAMTVADAAYGLTGVSDPRTWTATDWVSDIVPHLIYGIVTVATFETIATLEIA
jgi:hypothetical protein